jgi:anti-sigma-K factor RskA
LNNEHYISSGFVEQYVLGLCTEQEQNEIEQLRVQDAVLDKAITNFEIELEEKMMRHSFLPGVNTDDKILQALKDLGPKEEVPVISINNVPRKVVRFSFAKIAAAAAMLLFCVSAFFNFTQYKQNKEQSALLDSKNYAAATLPASNYNILKDPSITPVAMLGQGYHSICRCTMFWDKNTGKAYVMVHHLVASGDNYEYQLWANVNGKQVSVGMINDAIRDRFVEVSGMPENANEFIVTLEKNGGATVPDKDIILKGTI